MPFLIDGYNLLWAINEIDEEPGSLTDLKLCRVISRYLAQKNDIGQMIFDGIGPPDKSGFDSMSHLEIIFAGLGKEADDIIEIKIKASTAPKLLRVVSNDNRLKKAARTRKAVPVKCETFWRDLGKQLNKGHKINEPPGKRVGLSESETNQWLEFFDID